MSKKDKDLIVKNDKEIEVIQGAPFVLDFYSEKKRSGLEKTINGLAGLAFADKKQLKDQGIRSLKAVIKGRGFWKSIKDDLEYLTENGQIKEGINLSDEEVQSFEELLDFINGNDTKQEYKIFEAVKLMWLSLNLKTTDSSEEINRYHYIRILTKLDSVALITLRTCYEIKLIHKDIKIAAEKKGFKDNINYIETWYQIISSYSGLNSDLIKRSEKILVENNLVNTLPNADRYSMQNARLTDLGLKIMEILHETGSLFEGK